MGTADGYVGRDLARKCQNSEHFQSLIESTPCTFHSPGHLGGHQQRIQRFEPCSEQPTLVGQGHDLLHPLPGSEPLAHFFKGLAKPRSRLHSPESLHGIIALFNSSMILLQPAVQIVTATVEDLPPQRLTDGPRIGVMSVGGDSLWGLACHG